jgi:hypothetical protein
MPLNTIVHIPSITLSGDITKIDRAGQKLEVYTLYGNALSHSHGCSIAQRTSKCCATPCDANTSSRNHPEELLHTLPPSSMLRARSFSATFTCFSSNFVSTSWRTSFNFAIYALASLANLLRARSAGPNRKKRKGRGAKPRARNAGMADPHCGPKLSYILVVKSGL